MSDRLYDHCWQHEDAVEEARRLIAFAVKMYRPRAVWAMCSGGNDSLCSTHVAMASGLVTGVASIDTTIGIKETRDHMTAVAARFGWPLRWLRPDMTYRDFCQRFGMPGPGRHDYVYAYLKERCVRALVRDSKKRETDKVLLITGVRLSESERRMGHVEPIYRDGAQVWVAPIINWDGEDKTIYQVNNAIPMNPVSRVLGMSGECLCGAFAKPGERAKIAAYFPDAETEIKNCEAIAASNDKPAKWGERPAASRYLCQQCDRKNVEAAC